MTRDRKVLRHHAHGIHLNCWRFALRHFQDTMWHCDSTQSTLDHFVLTCPVTRSPCNIASILSFLALSFSSLSIGSSAMYWCRNMCITTRIPSPMGPIKDLLFVLDSRDISQCASQDKKYRVSGPSKHCIFILIGRKTSVPGSWNCRLTCYATYISGTVAE